MEAQPGDCQGSPRVRDFRLAIFLVFSTLVIYSFVIWLPPVFLLESQRHFGACVHVLVLCPLPTAKGVNDALQGLWILLCSL